MWFMSFQLLLLLTIHNFHIMKTAEPCPESCSSCTNSIFKCDKSGLQRIPNLQRYYSTDTLNLPKTIILTNQRFSLGILSSFNFTNLSHLTHLTIRTSNINIIRPKAFEPLVQLDQLDLSENVDLKISRNAFAHLRLSKLNLDYIGTLSLNEDSFNLLSLTTLSIQNSHLLTLSPRLLKPLHNSLKFLLLKHNLLRTLDIALKPIFETLSLIELDGNRFMCDCKIIWLSKILKIQHSQHLSASEYPKCVSPPKFRKKYLHQIIDNIHTCSPPKITKINIDLLSMSKARIDCITSTNAGSFTSSSSFSTTTSRNSKVAWLQNDIYSREFSNPLTITMNKLNRFNNNNNNNNNFICKAENPNGFVKLDFSFAWTNMDSINNNNNNNINKNADNNKINNSSFNINTRINQYQNTNKKNQNYFHKEVFSILEMIFAILGTLIITIALFSIFCCYLNNHLSTNSPANHNMNTNNNGISLAAGFFKFRRVPLRNKKTFISQSNSNLNNNNNNNNSRIKSYLSYDKGIYSETGVYCENEDDKAPFRSNSNINNNNNSTININNSNTLKYPININNINNNNNNSNNNLDNFFPPPPTNLPTLPSHFHYN